MADEDLTDFSELDPDTVATARDRVRGWLTAFRGDVDSSAGLVGGLVGELLAVTLAAVDDRIDRYRRSGSLLVASENPEAFDADALDALVSNFRLSRLAGRKSTGRVTLVVRALVPVSVPAGFAFRAGAAVYVTETAFAGRVSADQVVADTDRLVAPTGDGRYSFDIEVAAESEGATGAVPRGEAVIPQSPIAGVTEAFAADDFAGGVAEETNDQLLTRALTGVSGRGPANRLGVTALLTQDETVGPLLSAVSVTGFGDEEQARYHGLRAIAHGGRADVYVRPSAGPTDVTHELSAVLTATTNSTGSGGTWSVSLSAAEYGGAYGVTAVAGSSAPDTDVYDILDVEQSWAPDERLDIETATEAAYTAVQTARVLFAAPVGSYAVGDTRTVYVTVRTATGVVETQALLLASDTRPTAGDLLARAAVPCRVRLAVAVDTPAGKTVDEAAVAAAAAGVVNGTGFTGRLYASQLVRAINDALADGQAVGDWALSGVIDAPTGDRLSVVDKTTLEVPWRPDVGVTYRTTAFYLSAADVAVTVRGVTA